MGRPTGLTALSRLLKVPKGYGAPGRWIRSRSNGPESPSSDEQGSTGTNPRPATGGAGEAHRRSWEDRELGQMAEESTASSARVGGAAEVDRGVTSVLRLLRWYSGRVRRRRCRVFPGLAMGAKYSERRGESNGARGSSGEARVRDPRARLHGGGTPVKVRELLRH